MYVKFVKSQHSNWHVLDHDDLHWMSHSICRSVFPAIDKVEQDHAKHPIPICAECVIAVKKLAGDPEPEPVAASTNQYDYWDD